MKVIDYTNIHGDLNETLQDYGMAQEQQAKHYRKQAIARFDRDRFEAKAWLVSKEQTTDNGRPPSNDWVEMELKDDEEMQELQADYIEARFKYEKALGIVKYLEYRLEALRTVESTQRVELTHHLKSE